MFASLCSDVGLCCAFDFQKRHRYCIKSGFTSSSSSLCIATHVVEKSKQTNNKARLKTQHGFRAGLCCAIGMNQLLCFHSAATEVHCHGSSQETWKQTFHRTERDVAVTWTITPLLQCNGGFLCTTALFFHLITLFLFIFECSRKSPQTMRGDGVERARCKQNVWQAVPFF